MARPKTLTAVSNTAAGATDSLLETKQGRRLVGPSVVQVSLNRQAVGINIEVTVGSEQVLPSGAVNVNATADELPSIRDDTIIETQGVSGEEVLILAQNTTAGALQARAIVRITELDDMALIQFMKAQGLVPVST